MKKNDNQVYLVFFLLVVAQFSIGWSLTLSSFGGGIRFTNAKENPEDYWSDLIIQLLVIIILYVIKFDKNNHQKLLDFIKKSTFAHNLVASMIFIIIAKIMSNVGGVISSILCLLPIIFLVKNNKKESILNNNLRLKTIIVFALLVSSCLYALNMDK